MAQRETLRDRRRWVAWAAAALGVFVVIAVAAWLSGQGVQATDDAFVDGDIVTVAAEAPGRVTAIDVRDNAYVRAGERLLQLDDGDLKLKLDEAAAGQAAAQAQRDGLPGGASKSQKGAAEAALNGATARASQVRLALSKTRPTAPVSGYVARRAVAVGGYVAPGQPLMAIVASGVWVTANFKETEIGRLRAGEAVDVTVDAYPGVRLKGHVDSLQRGSGQAFSLLPPDNASGNFVKVVQRVPVRIALDDLPAGRMMGPGLSAHVRVHVD